MIRGFRAHIDIQFYIFKDNSNVEISDTRMESVVSTSVAKEISANFDVESWLRIKG